MKRRGFILGVGMTLLAGCGGSESIDETIESSLDEEGIEVTSVTARSDVIQIRYRPTDDPDEDVYVIADLYARLVNGGEDRSFFAIATTDDDSIDFRFDIEHEWALHYNDGLLTEEEYSERIEETIR